MSERASNRLGRILAMVPWVLANPGVNISEVCDRFGYTRKELISDLNLLFVCGLPGYGPDQLMVAYVEDDQVIIDMAEYFQAAPRLSPAEALALLAAAMTLIGSGDTSPELASAVDKLSRSLLGPDERELLTVDMPTDGGLAAVLRGAAKNREVVRVEYRSLSTNQSTIRDIEPWSVFVSLGNAYVSGFCRRAGAERTFRIDRIRTVEPTGETFTVPDPLPEPNVRYEPDRDATVAIIDLLPGAEWVVEYYPVEVLDRSPHRTRIRFVATTPAVTARLLIRLGGRAELVEGDEVAKTVKTMRKAILARYGE